MDLTGCLISSIHDIYSFHRLLFLAPMKMILRTEKRGNFEQNKNFEFLVSNCSTHDIEYNGI